MLSIDAGKGLQGIPRRLIGDARVIPGDKGTRPVCRLFPRDISVQ